MLLPALSGCPATHCLHPRSFAALGMMLPRHKEPVTDKPTCRRRLLAKMDAAQASPSTGVLFVNTRRKRPGPPGPLFCYRPPGGSSRLLLLCPRLGPPSALCCCNLVPRGLAHDSRWKGRLRSLRLRPSGSLGGSYPPTRRRRKRPFRPLGSSVIAGN